MLLTPNFRPKTYHSHPQHQHKDHNSEKPSLDVNLLAHSSTPSQSLFPQYAAASLSSLSDLDPSTIPRRSQGGYSLAPSPSSTSQSNFSDFSSGEDQLPELMQSDSWVVGNPYTPKSVGAFSHNRESSLSSLGSAGPSSPFSHNTSNPQIAVTDSAVDGFSDMHASDNYHYHLGKTMASNPDSLFSPYTPQYHSENTMPDIVYSTSVAMHKPKSERTNLLPAPGFSSAFGSNRSHPGSVASSVGGDSPATPSLGEPDDERRRKLVLHNPPKLDRTMTDVYGDELYNPNFSITSAAPSHMGIPTSPGNEVFAQRLQAANSQHLSAVQSPISAGSRSRSPFRQGSPLAPAPSHDFTTASAVRFHSAQQMREQSKAENDARALQRQMAMKSEPETPKTISPKDAVLEFHEPEGGANFPLFSSHETTGFLYEQAGKINMDQVGADIFHQRPRPGPESNQFHYQHLSPGVQVPQQYPFIPQARISTESPSHFSSADSSSGESHTPLQKPGATGADGGTYTCTYHGCTLRFDSPALLQKHKREGHRQAQGLTSPRKSEPGIPANLLNSQAGPHKCERINPSTGKPCNTIFSRPYDLTRHEDTIHNGRKQKVRCGLCTEEKTFSRADALTRHYRVCHPDVEFPGKHRRRGGHA